MEHKRTWIYCRVAYPDARALASQQAALEAFAEKQGFEIAGTTAEQASGLDFSRRGLTEVSKEPLIKGPSNAICNRNWG